MTKVHRLKRKSVLAPGPAALQSGPGIPLQTSVLQEPMTHILPSHKTTGQLECKKHHVIFKEIVCPKQMCVLCYTVGCSGPGSVFYLKEMPLLENMLWG